MKTLGKGLLLYGFGILFCVKRVLKTILALFMILIVMPLDMIYSIFCKEMTFDEWYDQVEIKECSSEEES